MLGGVRGVASEWIVVMVSVVGCDQGGEMGGVTDLKDNDGVMEGVG